MPTVDFLDRIGLEVPVVQAGMGGGVAGPELAGAVSAAGALGTIGITGPASFAAGIQGARSWAPGRPVAANLLVPFTRRAHIHACITAGAALVVFHGGFTPRWVPALRSAGIPVLVTVGTPDHARVALATGADGLVVQGIEAGGHVVGTEPVGEALPRVRTAVGDDLPLLAAGGVADATDVRRLLDAGATAVVAGTRFLLTEESLAHPDYKQHVLDAERTLLTMLFGVGWPLLHRVVPNAATDRWCAGAERGPRWVRGIGRFTAPLGRALPIDATASLTSFQRIGLPFFSPGLPLAGMPASSVDRTALYAGESLHRMAGIVPAADAVSMLTP